VIAVALDDALYVTPVTRFNESVVSVTPLTLPSPSRLYVNCGITSESGGTTIVELEEVSVNDVPVYNPLSVVNPEAVMG
jgi:hypothetical protein